MLLKCDLYIAREIITDVSVIGFTYTLPNGKQFEDGLPFLLLFFFHFLRDQHFDRILQSIPNTDF